MLPDEKRKCHCTGFTRGCRELVLSGECQGRWVQIQGANPQTGEPVSRWDCVDNLGPMLLLENTQAQRHTCASVDMLRKETQGRGDAQTEAMVNALRLAHEAAAESSLSAQQPLQLEDRSAG